MQNALRRCLAALGAVACIAALGSSCALAQGIQKWIDKDGKVHYGDAPPPEAQTSGVGVHAGPTSHDAQGHATPAPVPKKAEEPPGKIPEATAAKSPTTKPAGGKIIIDPIENDCEARIARLHAQIRQYHKYKHSGPAGAPEILEAERLDQWTKQEDEWIEKHCPQLNTPKLETVH